MGIYDYMIIKEDEGPENFWWTFCFGLNGLKTNKKESDDMFSSSRKFLRSTSEVPFLIPHLILNSFVLFLTITSLHSSFAVLYLKHTLVCKRNALHAYT